MTYFEDGAEVAYVVKGKGREHAFRATVVRHSSDGTHLIDLHNGRTTWTRVEKLRRPTPLEKLPVMPVKEIERDGYTVNATIRRGSAVEYRELKVQTDSAWNAAQRTAKALRDRDPRRWKDIDQIQINVKRSRFNLKETKEDDERIE